MLVATCDQTLLNGPTVFLLDETLWWVNLKKGDALIFNGEIIHRGTQNGSDMHRDLIYAIYTKEWYNEEIL
jgi:ectoine hydroxylase-related dioxygenase (phytanoyl-CoA dioxygenase family)